MKKTCSVLIVLWGIIAGYSQDNDWYYTHETSEPDQLSFVPTERFVYRVKNTLEVTRESYPVVITRAEFPFPDIHEMWITVVDPTLPPYEGPTAEVIKVYGGHQLRAEEKGHAIFHQLDDLDKDGIWDELFFQIDLKANEEKIIYIYLGENAQGWNKHKTHANIGSYCRHLMPFWETEHVGWKIWFANCVDVYAKRKPVLMAQQLYMNNLDGYGVSVINSDWGSDIQSVAGTMGGGAIGLFEHPDVTDSISLPRYTPIKLKQAPRSLWNAGQISDTRYAYEVVVNGPLRSMVKIKTMNWNTESGSYDLVQYYSVYADQSYTTCRVEFLNFHPKKEGVKMACGIRKKPGEEKSHYESGLFISSGPEEVRDPEKIDDRAEWILPFIGKALVVPEKYMPQYQLTGNAGGNHTFKIIPDSENRFEYLLFAAWSEGSVYNTMEDFKSYVLSTANSINNPVEINFVKREIKKI